MPPYVLVTGPGKRNASSTANINYSNLPTYCRITGKGLTKPSTMTSADPPWKMKCRPTLRVVPNFSPNFDRIETFVSLAEIKYSFDNVEKWVKPESAPLSIYSLTSPKIRKEAKGVVLIFVPYNYPVFLLMSPIVSDNVNPGESLALHLIRLALLLPETPFASRPRNTFMPQVLSWRSFSLDT